MPRWTPFVFCAAWLLLSSAQAQSPPGKAFTQTLAAAEAGDLETFQSLLSRRTHLAMELTSGTTPADWYRWSAAVLKESLPLKTLKMRRGLRSAVLVTQRVDMDGKSVRFRMVRDEHGWKLDLRKELIQWQHISRDLHEAIENMRKATPLLGREFLPTPRISP